jgi:hypothetical protein
MYIPTKFFLYGLAADLTYSPFQIVLVWFHLLSDRFSSRHAYLPASSPLLLSASDIVTTTHNLVHFGVQDQGEVGNQTARAPIGLCQRHVWA